MANPANDTLKQPFMAFNFAVEIRVPGLDGAVCSAAFAECDGLEMTLDAKTLRQGGDNARQIRLAGPVSYATLTLKRGMTASFDLWDWFHLTLENARLRADAEVVIMAPDHSAERARFVLTRCLPIKLKAPPLNAREGTVAIEELQIAYESLALKKPAGGGGGVAVGVSISGGLSASGSAGFRIG